MSALGPFKADLKHLFELFTSCTFVESDESHTVIDATSMIVYAHIESNVGEVLE